MKFAERLNQPGRKCDASTNADDFTLPYASIEEGKQSQKIRKA